MFGCYTRTAYLHEYVARSPGEWGRVSLPVPEAGRVPARGWSRRRWPSSDGGETGRVEAGRNVQTFHNGTLREPRVSTLFGPHALPAEATLFADGGARGNPGPAASGAVLVGATGEILAEVGLYLGIATNNVAEWTALCIGLETALERGIRRLAVRLDSELVVKQINGEYRVKHAGLQSLYRRARGLLREFESIDVAHVPRSSNKLADRLVNRVLDEAKEKA